MRPRHASSIDPSVAGTYDPPPCHFDSVTFNLTVLSRGKQFDRLALMYFGDTEIFRTSTAEPTLDGIRWTYVKDMSSYLALFKTSQKIIFDLGNLIDQTYTAPFNVTLTASFFDAARDSSTADSILPISARRASSNMPSAFSLPGDNATDSIVLPRNVRRAVASLSACGQADEEFWFGNVLSSDTSTFPTAGETLLGYSPFREVQLLIDGHLAGVSWPFPVIFTGGVVPGLWRPIVGIDAFDLREHEIDITPWLPLLCDGSSAGHAFEIRVVGIADDGQGHGQLSTHVGNSWVVTGKIFLWLDEPGHVTTGVVPVPPVAMAPSISLSSTLSRNASGSNDTLAYDVVVHRRLAINATVMTSTGLQNASWSQALDYSNHGSLAGDGNVQVIDQETTGYDSSSGFASSYRFPVSFRTSFTTDPKGNFSIEADINRGLYVSTYGQLAFSGQLDSADALQGSRSGLPSFSGTTLHTAQNGSGLYMSAPTDGGPSLSYGATEQDFVFGGIPTAPSTDPTPQGSYELYQRHVLAVNGSVTRDEESLLGRPTRHHSSQVTLPGADAFVASSIKATLGRGPGKAHDDYREY